MKSPPYLEWVLPLILIRVSVQYKQEDNTKRVNYPRVCPMLYAMSCVYLNQITTTEQNIVYWNEIAACLNVNV